jgi:hypothetical protein
VGFIIGAGRTSRPWTPITARGFDLFGLLVHDLQEAGRSSRGRPVGATGLSGTARGDRARGALAADPWKLKSYTVGGVSALLTDPVVFSDTRQVGKRGNPCGSIDFDLAHELPISRHDSD